MHVSLTSSLIEAIAIWNDYMIVNCQRFSLRGSNEGSCHRLDELLSCTWYRCIRGQRMGPSY